MKVGIINYGMGNLGSVRRAIEDLGAEPIVANNPSVLSEMDRIILPGVGAFAEGMALLTRGGWLPVLNDLVMLQNKPLLGICLGMQMLASKSDEGTDTKGLDFISGEVKKIDLLGCRERIPHMGWNEVHYQGDSGIFNNVPNSSDFYFVHSHAFVASNPKHIIALVNYGCELTAVVRNKHVFGCQFHPEKSSKVGRQLLQNFLDYSVC